MAPIPWNPSLLPVPPAWDQEDEARLPPAQKLYVLQTLPLPSIKAVGFDMDYTLARYRSPEIDELAFKKSLRLLVREKGYPASLLDSEFDPKFSIRGLVLDGVRGNLLKVSRERRVVRATHGTKPMDRVAIETCYGRRRLSTTAKGFRSIDTMFEIPESHLYALLVDRLDEGRMPGKDYIELFNDVRWGIDTVHRYGDMKAEILAHHDFFIPKDPQLPAALDRWIRAGKKLFLLTNSEWTFTNGVLGHLLNDVDAARPLWTDYFHTVVVSSRKPAFFAEAHEAVPMPEHANVFTGGNADWLEARLEANGEEVLYIGDHIYGDILKSKKSLSWHTLMLIPELEAELEQLELHADDIRELLKVETQRRRGQRRVNILSDQIARNHEHRRVLAPRISPEALHAMDHEAAILNAELAEVRQRTEAQREKVHELNKHVENSFNSVWGTLFREGDEQTRLGDQIQQYAGAYTGKISNLYMVDPNTTVYAPALALPHERV